MRLQSLAASSLLLVLLLSAVADVQQLPEVAPGARVRIRAPGVVAGSYTGTVLSRSADTLVVAGSAAAAVRVPIASLTQVEVSRGRSRSRGASKGALWGAGIGLAIGVVTMGIADDANYGSQGEYVAFNAVGGAIWGVIIGAIVGSERWDGYQLPLRASLVRPAGPGDRIGLRLALVP